MEHWTEKFHAGVERHSHFCHDIFFIYVSRWIPPPKTISSSLWYFFYPFKFVLGKYNIKHAEHAITWFESFPEFLGSTLHGYRGYHFCHRGAICGKQGDQNIGKSVSDHLHSVHNDLRECNITRYAHVACMRKLKIIKHTVLPASYISSSFWFFFNAWELVDAWCLF